MPQLRHERLEALQQAHGWSNRELARRLHFSASHVCMVKKQQRSVTAELMDALCEIFQVRYDVLFVHPSVKIDGRDRQTRWYDQAPRRQPSRLCNDPEHGGAEYPKQHLEKERGVAALIPQQIRKRFWGFREGREIRG